jgi:hypothetical protein
MYVLATRRSGFENTRYPLAGATSRKSRTGKPCPATCHSRKSPAQKAGQALKLMAPRRHPLGRPQGENA